MKKQIIEFLISCFLFLLFDFAFLIWNRNVFESQIIEVQRVALKIKWEGGIACYFFLLFGESIKKRGCLLLLLKILLLLF